MLNSYLGAFAEGFTGALRLSKDLVTAPFKVVADFVTRDNRNSPHSRLQRPLYRPQGASKKHFHH